MKFVNLGNFETKTSKLNIIFNNKFLKIFQGYNLWLLRFLAEFLFCLKNMQLKGDKMLKLISYRDVIVVEKFH